jgi:hypothetical protein
MVDGMVNTHPIPSQRWLLMALDRNFQTTFLVGVGHHVPTRTNALDAIQSTYQPTSPTNKAVANIKQQDVYGWKSATSHEKSKHHLCPLQAIANHFILLSLLFLGF